MSKGIPSWLTGVRGTQVLPIIESKSKIIRVEAGPGTGKTFGLVRRVQRLLHPNGENVSGNDVLVVAFNRVIAKQLKEEISTGLATSPHDGDPVIMTVHAMCLMVVGGKLRILLPHEVEAMIYDVFTTHPKLKTRLIKRKKAEQALRSHEAGNSLDPELWQAVVLWLKRHDARLISEIPTLLSDRIKGGDFTDRRFKHVIVDEFQDLTDCLQRLFLQLRAPEGSFLALGDPRQSIYAFLGNEPDGLAKIPLLVSPEKVDEVSMTECQRCPVEIVTAANQLTALSPAIPMTPGNPNSAEIHVLLWNTIEQEAKGIAKAIVENMKEFPNDKHLVMVTRRAFGYSLRERVLELNPKLDIDLSFSESLLESWTVREAFLFFCLVVDPDPATWRAWFAYANSDDGSKKNSSASNRNSDAYLKFLTTCKDRITIADVESLASSGKASPGSGGKNLLARAMRFVELQKIFLPPSGDLTTFAKDVFDISKWRRPSGEEGDISLIDMKLTSDKSSQILAEVNSKNPSLSIAEKLKKTAEILRYQIATREPFISSDTADLQITTLWGAKGITADHVYIVGLCSEALPGTRRDDYPGTDTEYFEEQRRLFYVSITRAKKSMILSRAAKIKHSSAANLGLTVRPSRSTYADLEMCDFLRDISSFLPKYEQGEKWKRVKKK